MIVQVVIPTYKDEFGYLNFITAQQISPFPIYRPNLNALINTVIDMVPFDSVLLVNSRWNGQELINKLKEVGYIVLDIEKEIERQYNETFLRY